MNTSENQGINHTLKNWLLAIRPKTLPAAAAPVIVGTSLAISDGGFAAGPALAALLGALLLQIGSNIANDYYDFKKGADAGERLGPTRVTQTGLLTPKQIMSGMIVVFGLSALVGVYLIIEAGWPILVVGVAAILSAIAYTGGPYPLGYHGLGDLFVFIFFGLSATAGTYYVQTLTVTPLVWWMSVAMGLLTVSILVVNNLRDIENDRRVGKRTLAVHLGPKKTRIEYVLCIVGAYSIPIITWLTGVAPAWGLVVVLSFPFALRWMRAIYATTGKALNQVLAGTGKLELIYALLFGLGIVLSAL